MILIPIIFIVLIVCGLEIFAHSVDAIDRYNKERKDSK